MALKPEIDLGTLKPANPTAVDHSRARGAMAVELQQIYQRRFADTKLYRGQVWPVLIEKFFQRWIPADHVVLDLGCGYGEFINNVRARQKYAMDLNPHAANYLDGDVELISQDCSTQWPLEDGSLDTVFTSNFFEHLPSKEALNETLSQVARCLRPGGQLIAMGPNIRAINGAYWDFWDHHLPLSDRSLVEALQLHQFQIRRVNPRFLPFTLVGAPRYPLWMLGIYLQLPLLWPIFGEQFLVTAVKPTA